MFLSTMSTGSAHGVYWYNLYDIADYAMRSDLHGHCIAMPGNCIAVQSITVSSRLAAFMVHI